MTHTFPNSTAPAPPARDRGRRKITAAEFLATLADPEEYEYVTDPDGKRYIEHGLVIPDHLYVTRIVNESGTVYAYTNPDDCYWPGGRVGAWSARLVVDDGVYDARDGMGTQEMAIQEAYRMFWEFTAHR